MAEQEKAGRGWFIGLGVFVAIAAAGLAGFLGAWASLLYGAMELSEGRNPDAHAAAQLVTTVGIWSGAGAGLIAAAIWCRSMFRAVARGARERLMGRGARLGLLVGVLATVLLHAGLIVASLACKLVDVADIPFALAIGLLFGLVAGLILGAVCGSMCQGLAKPLAEPG